MERYDFTDHVSAADQVLAEVEELSNKERLALREAMEQIKAETETETITKHLAWFDTAILPILKEYEEQTSSILDIERDRGTLIQATLRNSCGLDISSDSHRLYMAIMSAIHIFVDVEDGDPVLILTYDLKES